MSDATFERSPLAAFLAGARQRSREDTRSASPGVTLSERPLLGYLNLRAEPSVGLLETIERTSGVRLPLKPNTLSEAGEIIALWLGPNEWLLVTPPGGDAALMQMFDRSRKDFFLVNVTHGNTTIRIRGPKTIETLSKGCSLDLNRLISCPESCAQTLLAKAQVVVRLLDDSPSFDLIVRRSFAEYLALWLEDASLEYGLAIS